MAPILLASGSNSSGQLSIGHCDDVHHFTRSQFHPSLEAVLDGSVILDLVSSSAHALMLLRDRFGETLVLGEGTNTLGQLGPRCALWDEVTPETRWKPVDLLTPLGLGREWKATRIATTWTTSFVVYRHSPDDGGAEEHTWREMVVACGSNDFGELGVGGHAEGHIAVTHASDLPTVVPVGLEEGESVEMIKGGQRHVIAVIKGKGGQRVVGWGASRKGELDITSLSSNLSSRPAHVVNRKGKGKAVALPTISPPTTIPLPIPPGVRIIDIALGASHSLSLLSNGRVLGWGSDAKGQLSGVHEVEEVTQIAATWGGSYFLSHGRLLSQGANGHSQLLRPCSEPRGPVNLSDVPDGNLRLAAGSEHILIGSDADGVRVWAGGWNEHGNLGLGDKADRGVLERVNLRDYPAVRVREVWGGCAASWIYLDNRQP